MPTLRRRKQPLGLRRERNALLWLWKTFVNNKNNYLKLCVLNTLIQNFLCTQLNILLYIANNSWLSQKKILLCRRRAAKELSQVEFSINRVESRFNFIKFKLEFEFDELPIESSLNFELELKKIKKVCHFFFQLSTD
mgnify:CR=1 FL=1